MSFQAYLDNIQKKTGVSPDGFRKLAEDKGYTENGRLKVKAGEILQWLKGEYELGHGHAMAVYALLNGKTA